MIGKKSIIPQTTVYNGEKIRTCNPVPDGYKIQQNLISTSLNSTGGGNVGIVSTAIGLKPINYFSLHNLNKNISTGANLKNALTNGANMSRSINVNVIKLPRNINRSNINSSGSNTNSSNNFTSGSSGGDMTVTNSYNSFNSSLSNNGNQKTDSFASSRNGDLIGFGSITNLLDAQAIHTHYNLNFKKNYLKQQRLSANNLFEKISFEDSLFNNNHKKRSIQKFLLMIFKHCKFICN